MAKDISDIINAAAVVRDETGEAANTAARVGGSIADVAQYIQEEIITPLLAAQSQAVSAERIAEYSKKIAEEAAAKISVAIADKGYVRQNIYYLQEGIGCAAFDYAMSLGDVPIQSEVVTRQEGDSIILDTSANRFVLERSGRFYTKFLSNGARMQGADAYASDLHTFLNRQDTTYWYRKADGTLTKGSSTFVIKNWLEDVVSRLSALEMQGGTSSGLEALQVLIERIEEAENKNTEQDEEIVALKAKDIEQDNRISNAEVIDTPWTGNHINAFTERGEFHIYGERTNANDGLPILNAASGHTIDARLTVLDGSLTNGTGAKTDICVTQILRLNNRHGGDGHVFVRTGQAATKEELTASNSTKWGTWEKLMGMFEKNVVNTVSDLDGYTTNGMYSGMFNFEGMSEIGGGVEIFTGSTFLMVTVNGYAVASEGLTPQLTQMLYLLPAANFYATAKMYLRTAAWDASTKAWVYQNWDRIATGSEIATLTQSIASANTAASNAATAALDAQSTANAAQEKNSEQDTRLNTAEATINSEKARLDEVRRSVVTNISVTGDEEGVKIIAENTIEPAGGDIKIPNAGINKAGVVTSAEISALYELDLAAASVTDIALGKDAEKNTLTFDALGNLGQHQSHAVELTPATTEEAGLMSADDKAKFEALKVEFEKVKNSIGVNIYGSVRVSGISDPQLTFRRYIADGAAGNPLDVIHPCLVEKGTGKLLHVLQNLNFEKDINGAPRKIDGSEGEVYITNTEPIYHITGHVYVNGVSYDVFLRSLYPFTWQGKEAEVIEPFGLSPDNCVAHKDDDGVTRMHSVYNPEWAGSYYAMNGFVGKYVYEGIGNAMTDTYDANGALFDGAGGLASVYISLTNGEQYAMNMNEDTTKTVPFFNEHAYALELFIGHMYAEGGTYDAHNAALMGSGFTANDNVTNAAHFNADNEPAVNGARYLGGDGNTTRYVNNSSYGQWYANGTKNYLPAMLTNWSSPWKIMERQRVMAYAIERNIPELTWFAFEGNKYKWRSVSGFAGPNDGVMTCVVFKIFSTQFAADMVDQTGGASLEGHRIDFMITGAIYRGWSTDVSPSRWDSGLIFTTDNTALYKAYIQRDQSKMIKSASADANADTVIPFEESYEYIGSVQGIQRNFRRDFSDGSLFHAKRTELSNVSNIHTYIGAYNWYDSQSSAAGLRSVRGFRRGYSAAIAYLSPCAVGSNGMPSYANSHIGFGTCVRIAKET